MENNIITPITNGLLTEITGNITETGYNSFFSHRREICKITKCSDTLLNLLKYTKSLTPGKTSYNISTFCPLLFLVTTNKTLVYHGILPYNSKRSEVKEACRQNKAIYIAEGLGMIIYSMHKRPSTKTYDENKDEIAKFLKRAESQLDYLETP